MHDQLTANQLATMKFGVGQSVPRSEDPKLLRGEGRYTDDVNLPGQAHGFVVRSHYAHGRIRDLDLSDALEMPGVLGIFTAADLDAAGYGSLKCLIPLKNRDGSDFSCFLEVRIFSPGRMGISIPTSRHLSTKSK